MPKSALVCSKDPQLLMTRSRLLEKAGFIVTKAKSMGAIEELSGSASFDLAVLGQTFELHEIQAIVRLICKQWPTIRILILNINEQAIVDIPGCENLLALDGPEALLAKVKEMLATGDRA